MSQKNIICTEDYQLNEKDEMFLKSETVCVNDHIINCARVILHKQFLHVCGFQNTENSKNEGFVADKNDFMQILDISDNHWLTIKSKDLLTVHIYDSIPPKPYPISFLENIATIIKEKKKRKFYKLNIN